MTSSDNRMDRELRGQGLLAPSRSVWPEVELHLDRLECRVRRSGRLKIAVPAVAASLVVGVVLYDALAPAATDVSAMQQTVDAAVRHAMPVAAFPTLQVSSRNLVLEALLVSARPRDGIKVVPLGGSLARDKGGSARQGPPAAQPPQQLDQF